MKLAAINAIHKVLQREVERNEENCENFKKELEAKYSSTPDERISRCDRDKLREYCNAVTDAMELLAVFESQDWH